MPELSYPRIALGVYVLGLVLTIVYNVFNGRIGATRAGLGALIFKSMVNRTSWRMF